MVNLLDPKTRFIRLLTAEGMKVLVLNDEIWVVKDWRPAQAGQVSNIIRGQRVTPALLALPEAEGSHERIVRLLAEAIAPLVMEQLQFPVAMSWLLWEPTY